MAAHAPRHRRSLLRSPLVTGRFRTRASQRWTGGHPPVRDQPRALRKRRDRDDTGGAFCPALPSLYCRGSSASTFRSRAQAGRFKPRRSSRAPAPRYRPVEAPTPCRKPPANPPSISSAFSEWCSELRVDNGQQLVVGMKVDRCVQCHGRLRLLLDMSQPGSAPWTVLSAVGGGAMRLQGNSSDCRLAGVRPRGPTPPRCARCRCPKQVRSVGVAVPFREQPAGGHGGW